MENESKKIWANCLSIIKEKVTPQNYDTIFSMAEALNFANNELTLRVPSAHVYEQMEGDFFDVLRLALRTVVGDNVRLLYKAEIVKQTQGKQVPHIVLQGEVNKKIDSSSVISKKNVCINPFESEPSELKISSQLNPDYSMETFVSGGCNALAKNAGMSITNSPGETAFNPFFIYGGSGLGKTHLAQAIGLEVKRKMPSKVVLYVSANLFQTQFTEAVRKGEVNNFLYFYQLIDVLIIDDIHEFAGKISTQNTFFHIFNYLQQHKKQLIMTCDKSPAELEGIEDRLLTRFRWGLSVEIKAPDFDTRKKIAEDKIHKAGIDFSDEIIDFICKNVDTNIRELEGSIISLLAQSAFLKRDVTIELAAETLGKIVRKTKTTITIDHIQNVICDYFKVDKELIGAKSRKREIVKVRQLAMYFSKNLTKYSLSYIGNKIGNRDHSTVLYACRMVDNMMETDKKFRLDVEELQKRFYI